MLLTRFSRSRVLHRASSVLLGAVFASSALADVSLTINGQPARPGDMPPGEIQSLVIDNGQLKIAFGKDVNGDFSGTSVVKNGQELAHNLKGIEPRDVDRGRTFYLDSGAGRSHLEADKIKVYKNSPEMAHFAVTDNRAGQLEHHFVMMKDQSGIYAYVVIKSAQGEGGGGGRGGRGGGGVNGETRTMYRFDRNILDYAWCAERTGQQPKYADLVTYPEVQDETWKLPDGSTYQKYDYSAYYSESPMWGHYGHGFGVWFMPVSTEYYAGGPLRQELIVHQDALILNYIGGGHYGGGGGPQGRNGTKVNGPWYLYFNTGEPQAMIADALKVASAEQAKWPYQWVEEGDLYPKSRTKVTGQLKVTHDRSAANAYVILGQPGGGGGGGRGGRGNRGGGGASSQDRAAALYTQSGDYIFYVKADANGRFTLPNVRPGTYTLYAWQTQGPITSSLAKDDVEIGGAATQDLGIVEWDAPYRPNVLWQIGKADRMAGEFKFGNELRSMTWVEKVPANLTYTVGQSNFANDWYYAQTQVGQWDVNFNLDRTFTGNACLTVAIAGGGGGASTTISVNGQELQTIAPGNDASTYRAALRSGAYGLYPITFPANVLKQGQNTVRFNMTAKGGRWNGLMWDTVVLEAD